MIERTRLINTLIEWKDTPNKKPLIIRGARQVGKTHLIAHFGQKYFKQCIVINFESHPSFKKCFEELDPFAIVRQIGWLLNCSIQDDNQTLLFLDEIQECPQALLALRYFKEQRPGFPVIAAGSLLEFLLSEGALSIPVGRVQYLYVYPLSFSEYLQARGLNEIAVLLNNISLEHQGLEKESPLIPTAIHEKLLLLLKEYMIIGGMPEAVSCFLDDQNFQKVQRIQESIVTTYRDDFAKYAKKKQIPSLQNIFEKIPGLIGEVFRYSKIDPDKRATELKLALECLVKAGIVHRVHQCSASGLPLMTTRSEHRFKVQFLDIGLAVRALSLSADCLLQDDFFALNRGALMEQFVGQELLACEDPYKEGHLYYWSRDKKGSTAEVDFIYAAHAQVIPIEVKAGKTGRLKSLQVFMAEKQSSLGLKLSLDPLELKGHILCVPAYMIASLPRLIIEAVRNLGAI